MAERNCALPPRHNPYLHELVWNLLKNKQCGHLLDIPSGPGYFALNAQEHGFEVTAAEIDESLHFFDKIRYRKTNMSDTMLFDSESFDYIVSIEGIEHIENQFGFLRECSRLLTKDGMLFLTTPNASSLANRFTYLLTGIHEKPSIPIRTDSENIYFEHINLIPFFRLELFLRLSGFQIEILTTYRLKKGSLVLYPFVRPILSLKNARAFRRHFASTPESGQYGNIQKMYCSKTVLCGSHIIIAAKKTNNNGKHYNHFANGAV